MSDNWPELEFKSFEDDTWYDVDVWSMSDAFVVIFTDFLCEQDELCSAYDFKTMEDLKLFGKRFRVVSPQMQDEQCPIVRDGTLVCATLHALNGDVKYYDSTVVADEKKEHGWDEEGGELCYCRFKLFWEDGPSKDQFTFAEVGDIFLRHEDDRMHPAVVSSMNEVKKKINGGASSSHQGEETEWQKTIRKVKHALRNYNVNSSVPETQD